MEGRQQGADGRLQVGIGAGGRWSGACSSRIEIIGGSCYDGFGVGSGGVTITCG
jgi:hypothetical protein